MTHAPTYEETSTVVGDELWDMVDSLTKAWRVSCGDKEGQDLLHYLAGHTGRHAINELILGLPTFGCDEHCLDKGHAKQKLIASIIINTTVNGADDMEDLVYALASDLARMTKTLESIKKLAGDE